MAQSAGSENTTWDFSYDVSGNRTRATATGATSSDQQLTYNAVGQITNAGYSYDGGGNLTAAPGATYTYNGAQQMTSSTKDGKAATYQYAGADMTKLLKQETEGAPQNEYTYGASGSNGVPVLVTRSRGGADAASVVSDPTNGHPLDLRSTDGMTTLYVFDGLGSPVAAISNTGSTAYRVSYEPSGLGKITEGSSSIQWNENPFGFKAGIRSSDTSTGITKFGYRWHSAETGSWVERDTLDAPLDPANANRYAFAGADPVNGADPAGRWTPSWSGFGRFSGSSQLRV